MSHSVNNKGRSIVSEHAASVRYEVKRLASGGPITAAVASQMLQSIPVYAGSSDPAVIRRHIRFVLESEAEFTDEGRKALERAFADLSSESIGRPTPNSPRVETRTYEASYRPWTSTYWPKAAQKGQPNGSPQTNLWAKNGPLDKFDALLKARGKPTGAVTFERTPAMNTRWGHEGYDGHYFPSETLLENDAEVSTGVDLNKNGKIDPGVAFDFLDADGNFGEDGRTDGKMSVGWWGSCWEVALAGIIFKEPKKSVTLNGVTFTPLDIKGLLTVIVSSQVKVEEPVGKRFEGSENDRIKLKSNTWVGGKILTPLTFPSKRSLESENEVSLAGDALPSQIKLRKGKTVQTLNKSDVAAVYRENRRDDPALFHETVIDWLESGKPGILDKESSLPIWNYSFYKANDRLFIEGARPEWADEELLKSGFYGPAGEGKITYVERDVYLAGESAEPEHYRYWLEEQAGEIVNSGWHRDSPNPDYLTRPKSEATSAGMNFRNPYVDPAIVRELYERSIDSKPPSSTGRRDVRRKVAAAGNSSPIRSAWSPGPGSGRSS